MWCPQPERAKPDPASFGRCEQEQQIGDPLHCIGEVVQGHAMARTATPGTVTTTEYSMLHTSSEPETKRAGRCLLR